MKIRYTNNTNARARRRLNKLRAKRNRVALWHRKFAWLPLKIDVPEDSADYSTVVCFEWVMQKAHVRDYQYRSIRKFIWTRYPEKEYFKKKLDGSLEKEEQFTHDGIDTDMSFQGGGAAGVSKGSPIKRSGPSGVNKGVSIVKGGVPGPSAGSSK